MGGEEKGHLGGAVQKIGSRTGEAGPGEGSEKSEPRRTREGAFGFGCVTIRPENSAIFSIFWPVFAKICHFSPFHSEISVKFLSNKNVENPCFVIGGRGRKTNQGEGGSKKPLGSRTDFLDKPLRFSTVNFRPKTCGVKNPPPCRSRGSPRPQSGPNKTRQPA